MNVPNENYIQYIQQALVDDILTLLTCTKTVLQLILVVFFSNSLKDLESSSLDQNKVQDVLCSLTTKVDVTGLIQETSTLSEVIYHVSSFTLYFMFQKWYSKWFVYISYCFNVYLER